MHVRCLPFGAPPSPTPTSRCGTAMHLGQSPRATSPDAPRGVALNLLASALTILSAIALVGTASVVGGGSGVTLGLRQTDELVRDFYRAVNEAIRTGDILALDRVV